MIPVTRLPEAEVAVFMRGQKFAARFDGAHEYFRELEQEVVLFRALGKLVELHREAGDEFQKFSTQRFVSDMAVRAVLAVFLLCAEAECSRNALLIIGKVLQTVPNKRVVKQEMIMDES